MLTGQAKKDYQRNYMRKKRLNAKSGDSKQIKTHHDCTGLKRSNRSNIIQGLTQDRSNEVKPQSYCPFMVGYVPPKG